MRTVIYFLTEAFRGLIGARLLTVVSIGTIGSALFFLGICCAAYLTVEKWVSIASYSGTITLYCNDRASDDTLLSQQALKHVRTLQGVDTVRLITKKMAWDRFATMYGTSMLSSVDNNPFPASLEVVVTTQGKTLAAIDTLVKSLNETPDIESVQYSRTYIDRLQKLHKSFGSAIIIIAIVIFCILIFMIANTIKLTIYGRKELVINMHFVGATGFFIRGPFIMEGIVQGCLGACVALIALVIVRFALQGVPLVWGGLLIPTIILSVGVVSGCIGSLGAVRKFLS